MLKITDPKILKMDYKFFTESFYGTAPLVPAFMKSQSATQFGRPTEKESEVYEALIAFHKQLRNSEFFHCELSQIFYDDMTYYQDELYDLACSGKMPAFKEESYIIHVSSKMTWLITVRGEGGEIFWTSSRWRANIGLQNLTRGVQVSDFYSGQSTGGKFVKKGMSINGSLQSLDDLHGLLGGELEPQEEDEDIEGQDFDRTWSGPLIATLYIKYGEIDTKGFTAKKVAPTTAPRTERRKSQRNFSKGIVKISSSWLNNLVVEGDINVRGHFRLQACGHGWTNRKIIYIHPHVRKGYNKAAERWSKMPSDN